MMEMRIVAPNQAVADAVNAAYWAAMAELSSGEVPVTVSAPEVDTSAPPVPKVGTIAPSVPVDARVPASSDDVDARGVPYNPDVHADRKGPTGGKMKDGTWRAKKNVDRAKYDDWQRSHQHTTAAAPSVATPGEAFQTQPPAGFGAPSSQAPVGFGGFAQAQPHAYPPVAVETFVALTQRLLEAGVLNGQVIEQIKAEVGERDEVKIQRVDALRAHTYWVLQRLERENLARAS